MGKVGTGRALLATVLCSMVLTDAARAGEVRARPVLRCRPELPYCIPTAFAFTPNGQRIFYTEKDTGQIRVRNLRTREDRLWTQVTNVATGNGQGLLGLALQPTWAGGPERHWVYAYYTDEGLDDPETGDEDTPDRNVLVRMRKDGIDLVTQELLSVADSRPGDNGGVLRFGPDGKLYVMVGDAAVSARAQDLADPAGKILRMNPDGSVPADNPFLDRPEVDGLVYSFGHRNQFGLAFDPRTGRLWESENGPECNDEINLVLPGGNYAWGPSHDCGTPPTTEDTNRDGPEPRILPRWTFGRTVTPTGVAFCQRCGLGPTIGGDLLMASYKLERIWAFDLNASRRTLIARRTPYRGDLGPIAVQAGPDGRIYFSDATGIRLLIRP
jgi:glucose/arabinose dehydrogenase